MSKVRSDEYLDRAGSGAPDFPKGINATGIITASSFSGNITGTATSATNAMGIIGSPGIAVADIQVGGSCTITGNLTVDGTQTIINTETYDVADKTVGIGSTTTASDTTANNAGIEIYASSAATGNNKTLLWGQTGSRWNLVGGGLNIGAGGVEITSGISTFKGANFNGGSLLKEKVQVTAGKLSDNLQINLDNGMLHYFTTQETATSAPNITSSVGISTAMAIGDAITLTVVTTAAAAGYAANWTIDHGAVTEEWNGGAAPSAGNASGLDVYTLTVIKISSTGTQNTDFKVLANLSNFD